MPRILLIEDNELNRDMLFRRLTRRGHEVLISAGAHDGIEIARDAQPDVILMDLGLPDLSGWEAAHALKSDPVTRHIGLLALTAHAMEGDRERALDAGCDDYESKPIDLPRLLDKIRDLAQLTHERRGPPDSLDGGDQLPAR